MDIKSKNKQWYIIVFIICAYLLGLSKLSLDDVIKNREYLKSEPYFTSSYFKHELVGYSQNIKTLNGIYKDYSQKTDNDKVTKEELILSQTAYETNLRNKEYQIENKYRDEIKAAEKEGNKDKANSLLDLKNKELDALKKQNTKTIEDFKKEIAEYKNKDYDNIKKAVKEKSIIKYYITKGKNNVSDTNIENVSDINSYVKNNALYSIKFPNQALKSNDEMASINQYFAGTSGEAYFIIPKDIQHSSYIYGNYRYYNSVRQRLIRELIIGIASLIIGFILVIYILKKKNQQEDFIEKLAKRYNKIPLDLRILIFIIYSAIINEYINKVMFYYKPYNLGSIYKLTVIALYIFYFIFNVREALNLKSHKEEFRLQVKKSLFYELLSIMKDKSIAESAKIKVITIIILTALLGVFKLGLYIVPYSYPNLRNMVCIISTLYPVFYITILLFYIFRTNKSLIKIIKGTEEIVSGNLNYTIEEKGTGDLFKLAHNINNMKASFKKSLENELKSEKLKSELITNVSHDLKTPLTSIINYVDLLKNEGLSKEEAQGYVDVLDRKAQRLRILIDDLFEAAKMASGAVELNIEKVDVNALLQQTLAELHEKINNSSLIFKLNLPKEKVFANLDGNNTWRVFENLINNILKYSQPKTRVYIDLVQQGSKIIITMKNVSSYEMDFDKEEIFERFKRGDKSRKTEGSGLGLSIAKSILELQGGSLSIETDGDLFKVYVTIPLFNSEQ